MPEQTDMLSAISNTVGYVLAYKISPTAFLSLFLMPQASALALFLFVNFRSFYVSSNETVYVQTTALRVISSDFSQLCERIPLNFPLQSSTQYYHRCIFLIHYLLKIYYMQSIHPWPGRVHLNTKNQQSFQIKCRNTLEKGHMMAKTS